MSNIKTELYLIRHAESTANVNNHLIGGRNNNVTLTQQGIVQSYDLGEYLVQNNIQADFAYASPAVRTVHTARNALEVLATPVELLIDDSLQELDQGEWTGRPRDQIYTEANLETIKALGKDFKPNGGESMNDVGVRMQNALTNIARQHQSNQTTKRGLIFTHGGAICCLASLIQDWPHEETYKTNIPNVSISLFTLTDDGWNIEYLAKPTATLQPIAIS